MFTVRIEVSFDAGHRLLGYSGKCASPHGHTFRAEVFFATTQLNGLGLALDFGDLKREAKGWIDEYWDHGFLLNDKDDVLIAGLRAVPEAKVYPFRNCNPSAEAMARELYCALSGRDMPISSVRIWESASQFAEYSTRPVSESIRRELAQL